MNEPAHQSKRLSWACLVGFGLGLVNLAKPLHIDDALYVAIAKRILEYPFDPFGGDYNWLGISQPVHEFTISPPLFCYYLAGVMRLFGDSDLALHAGMIPWMMLAAWSIERCCSRFGASSSFPSLAVLLSPPFLVCANAMMDIPVLGLICLALYWALRSGDDDGRPRHVIAAAVIGSLAVLTKFVAIALVPVVLAIAIINRRPKTALAAVGPILAFALWQGYTGLIYESSQLTSSLGFLGGFQFDGRWFIVTRFLAMLAILAMTTPFWLITALGGTRPALRRGLLAGVCGGGACLLFLSTVPEARLATIVVFMAAVFLGAAGLVGPLATAWSMEARPQIRRNLVLAVWIVAFAGTAILFSPFVAPRSFLPILPPLAILSAGAANISTRGKTAILMGTATISGILFWTDCCWARTYPAVAATIAERYAGQRRPIYFVGHWGWQHAMEKRGYVAWDERWLAAPPGAIFVIPERVHKQAIAPTVLARTAAVETISIPPHPLKFTVWNQGARVHFHAGGFLQLPWGFSNEPAERFEVRQLSSN